MPPTDWHQLHDDATLVDLHAHPTFRAFLFRRILHQHLWEPELLAGRPHPFMLQTSFQKLNKGNVDVVLSTAYPLEKRIFSDLRAFKLIPLRIIRYLPFSLAQSLWNNVVKPPYFTVTEMMLDAIEEEAAQYNQKLQSDGIEGREVRIAKSGAELEALLDAPGRPIVLIHSVEGGHSLEGPIAKEHLDEPLDSLSLSTRDAISTEVLGNLEALAQRGVAYLEPAHFYPNRIMMSTFPYPEHEALSCMRRTTLDEICELVDLTQGVTELGEKVVQRMIQLGILIDVSHASPKARQDVYDIVEASGVTRPCVVATHVGAYTINPSPYNLQDWEIRWIAEHGGVVGVIFMTYWLMPSATKFGVNSISSTLEHVRNVGGDDVLGIGSDFDGAVAPEDLVCAEQMPRLTQRLVSEYTSDGGRKYSDAQIEKLLGGNALRVLREGWGT